MDCSLSPNLKIYVKKAQIVHEEWSVNLTFFAAPLPVVYVYSIIGEGSAWERSTLSFLSRVLYSFKKRYLVNASFPRDETSGFYKYGNEWQDFGAVDAAWVISQEDFMQDNEFFDNLKIKGSYGV